MTSQLELNQKPFIELQIEALSRENAMKPKNVEAFIAKLESQILSIGSLNYNQLLEKCVQLPFIGRPNSSGNDYPDNFKFIPPEKLVVIGGYKTLTAVKRTSSVDLAIPMPTRCLSKKDIKNQKYHHKRALYLAQMGRLLSVVSEDLVENLEYKYHRGDFLKPVLLIKPKSAKLSSSNITFQLFVYPAEDAMKLSMLHPSHGNVSPRWFFEHYSVNNPDQAMRGYLLSDSDASATPFYNSSILSDLEMVANSNILFEQIGPHSSIVEALMLVKIWLYQRELHNYFSFILSMYTAYLQTKQVIHQNMSSFQIFKTILKSITNSDWIQTGLSYFEDSTSKIASFRESFPVIFLSPSGILNLCYNITEDLYNRLRHEAEAAQNIITSNCSNIFELLFLKTVKFVDKFDVIVHLPNCAKKISISIESLSKFMDRGASTPLVYAESILRTVKTGLTNRIVLMQQSPEHLMVDKSWSLESIPFNPSNEETTFTFGLLLDPERSLSIIDVGPEAQSKEAESFRAFWQPKCELRLQNGIISETVVWHVNCFSQRRAIIKHILKHAMEKRNIDQVVVHYTLLERFISLNNVFFGWKDAIKTHINESENNKPSKRKQQEDDKRAIGVGEEVFQKLLCAYNEFNKVLRNVDDVKYSITTVQPISPHLRSGAVFPPLPVDLQYRNNSLKRFKGVSIFPDDFDAAGKILHIEAVDILITLESNGKWPNDLEAFEAARLEYLIQLGEALKERDYCVKFAVDYLDVLHGQFIFRLHIKSPKHLSLISISSSKNEFQKRRMDLEIMPRIHSALDQLYREKPAFSLTCRLVKRWIFCQLLTDYFTETTLDLIVAHVFLNPEPYTEPSSSLCGFQRFLMLVTKHDWKQSPLVINFDNQLKVDEITRIKDAMLENRSKYPPMVILTPFDRETSTWTRANPTMPMLDLLVRICKEAHRFMSEDILSRSAARIECKALFQPNLKLFNLIIKLRSENVQNQFMRIDKSTSFRIVGREYEEKRSGARRVMPIIGLNLIESYVKKLRDRYDDVALFFYDKYGQQLIGVVLKPGHEKILGGKPEKFIKGVKKLGTKLVESITVVKNE